MSAFRTVVYLLACKPRAVIASNPPIFPGLLAFAYGWAFRVPVILDSHPASFGIYDTKKFVAAMMPVHRFLLPRVTATIVTIDELVQEVNRQGGRAEIVHEAPPLWEVDPVKDLGERPQILFVGIFADDEPTELVIEAARRLPGIDIAVTGDLRKCPRDLLRSSPANVRFTGFLGPEEYRGAIERANFVMTLSRTSEGVSRAANEAVFARRPLITSDWPATQQYFSKAVHVSNTVQGIVDGIGDALQRYDELRIAAEEARTMQERRWEQQLEVLRELIASDR